MIIKIYVLYNPINSKIRYIGRTKQTLKKRLAVHLSTSRKKRKDNLSKTFSHKENWINKLLKNGIKPKIRLLTTIKGWKESHILEKSLIQKHLLKHNLVNGDDRGPGKLSKNISKKVNEARIEKIKRHFNKEENKSNFYNKVYCYSSETGKLIKIYKSTKFVCEDLNINYTALINHKFRFDNCNSNVNPINKHFFSSKMFDIHPLFKKIKYQTNRVLIKLENNNKTFIFNCYDDFYNHTKLNSWDMSQYRKNIITKKMALFLEKNKINVS